MSNSASIAASDSVPVRPAVALSSRIRATSRRVHSALAWLVAVPVLVMLVTGIALQLRQDIEWIQPAARVGSAPGIPTLSLANAFEKASALPDSGIKTWQDVATIDVKPSKGVVSVRSVGGFEIQLDGVTGEVLSAAPRRTGLLIELHQGSFFHAQVMRWVFLPAGIGLLALWGTGLIMALKRRRTVKGGA